MLFGVILEAFRFTLMFKHPPRDATCALGGLQKCAGHVLITGHATMCIL